MSIEQMKAALLKAYSGQAWYDKVQRMSDKQIVAVYYRMLNANQL